MAPMAAGQTDSFFFGEVKPIRGSKFPLEILNPEMHTNMTHPLS